MESKSSGSRRSNENADGTLGLDKSSCKRGRCSAEVWPEGGGEKGGEADGDEEKTYFSLPGPTLMGSGEGGVGGDEDAEGYPFFVTSIEIDTGPLPHTISP